MKKTIKAMLGSLVLIIIFSSCASTQSYHQVKKGKYTQERGCPDCVKAW